MENITNNIRGIVEIEQVESDRIFQETVETWGIGLATAGITATAISPFVPNLTKNESTENLPLIEAEINFLFTILFSILIGIIAKSGAEIWIKLRRNPKSNISRFKIFLTADERR